jgi:pyruvate/2-oxoglutarate dehydrogenase complex dihydrolipoamide acyltransferase (E2) component
MYYSRVLKEPFASIEELKEAEEAYYAKLKAKEDKAAQKKADAALVEEAFRSLNNTRKLYKESLTKLAEKYSKDLVKLKETFDADRAELQDVMATAEEVYAAAIKTFTEKYPEGYHLTLKDGDFETTISSQTKTNKEDTTVADIFSMLFGF